MPPKTKITFFCNECGFESAKWLGKCPACEAWNSFTEEKTSKASRSRDATGFITLRSEVPLRLEDVSLVDYPRHSTGLDEFDRVLGGGLVPGTLVLIGGDPGIGKSTLVLQTLDRLTQSGISVLYVTGEESKEQIKLRAERLGVTGSLYLVAENNLDRILEHIANLKPQILIIDSIQTVYLPHLESAPGSVSQVRECAAKLLFHAKSQGTTTLLIGHVTKDGAIAGPRILEHMVDAVLYFEGENTGQFRFLRTIKNRYGSTNEIGVFEMTGQGLKEVHNPSQIFLEDRSQDRPGSCVTASVEGTRSLLIEIQALVTGSGLANPRRTSIGLNSNRVALILAVLEKYGGLKFFDQDVFVSAAGGLKLDEPASDVAILLSLASSIRNRPIAPFTAAVGELGLGGEVRSVSHLDKRLAEASKMGYKQMLIPASQLSKQLKQPDGIRLYGIKNVQDILQWIE